MLAEIVFPDEANTAEPPGAVDPELDGFQPVPDPSIITCPTIMDTAENFFEGEEICEETLISPKKRKGTVLNPVKWTHNEEQCLKSTFAKYIENGERPSPRKIRKLMPRSVEEGRTFSSIKNKIYRLICNKSK